MDKMILHNVMRDSELKLLSILDLKYFDLETDSYMYQPSFRIIAYHVSNTVCLICCSLGKCMANPRQGGMIT